ncbi:MAG: S41 family peptidase [Acetobacteraceae bacterium]
MRLGRALLLVLLITPAAAPAALADSVPHYPLTLSAEVFADALFFIQPRTLVAYPLPTLALWGLGGLSALDPSLSVDLDAGTLRLTAPDRVLAVEPIPKPTDAGGWGRAITALAAAAWQYSDKVRALGPGGVTQAFFDELFNHFDPYSRYVSPRRAAEERANRSGEAGAGISLGAENGRVVVRDVVAGGPAAAAGVQPGARLLFVNSTPATGRSLSDLEAELAGPVGSSVALTLSNPGHGMQRLALIRRKVPPETVFRSRDKDLLVLRISAFDATTGPHLVNEIEAGLSVANEPKGVVLDLRGNRGGLLDQAIYAADALLARGVIVRTAGRDPSASHLWRAAGAEMANGLPVVVVVDGLTASAAEILASALADNGRAVVIGSTTLGKGLVQTIEPLPDGGELFVTWSAVLAPRGWPIQGLGVLPQVCTSHGPLPLERQLALLAEGIQPMARAIYEHETARAPLPMAQILAIRSACPAAVGSEGDMAAARVLVDDPAAYAAALLPPAGRALAPPPPR